MNQKTINFRLEDFSVDSPIGQGAFGQIYRAVEQRSGNIYALKAINRRVLIKLKKQSQPINEKNALSLCESQNVVKLFGTFKDDSNLYFVFEMCEHGDLAEAVNEIGSLNTDVVRLLSAMLLNAISFCHSKNVIHRDIKPENVLLDNLNHVKLTDFGTAMILKNDGNQNEENNGQMVRSSIVGTPAFVAPELLNDGMICFSSDIWSFGCTMFNLLTGVAPFEGDNPAELMANISHLKFSPAAEKLPRRAKDLIQKILVLDPTKRIGYGENSTGYKSIKSHPFFGGVDFDNLMDIQMPLFTKFEEEPEPTLADEMLANDEKIVLQGDMEKKRTLGYTERLVFLTNKKRILLFKQKSQKFKGELKLAPGIRAEVSSNGKEWFITIGKTTTTFRCKDGTAGMWAASVMRESIAK
ncbi:AGC family protein kinase [Tritrichomonas foetus]|uniref:AGC family protein kinase n=1 Tax=Tritrichomonas foetus TaxID=1144522 RepID=A0A1J4L1Q5_9EUKA|nr:AGC family protein kinase [Tritrichomonas foetus]|eukprot:OHT17449.1 AGC family protein kinase [Tritrichomonas foetus]